MKKLTLICLMLTSTHLFAVTAATVLFTASKVTGMHNGSIRDIKRGTKLEPGDSVITRSGGKANIKYTNGTLVNLGENSNYTILDYSPKQGDVQIKSELSSGKMNSASPGKTAEQVKTPVVALAVLGTKFELAIICVKKSTNKSKNKKDCEQTANVNVVEGKVKVGNKIVGPGGSVVATSSGGVRPAPFPPGASVKSSPGAPGNTNISSSSGSTSSEQTSNYSGSVNLSTTQSTNSTTTTTTTSSTEVASTAAASVPVITCPPTCPPLLPIIPGIIH